MRKEKRFTFGKIAYTNKSRKANEVEVEICLRELDNGHKEFTAVGAIWNARHTDWVTGGQILDEIARYVSKNEVFDEIYALWKHAHLSGMHAGTKKQEAILDEHFKDGHYRDYGESVKVLKKHRKYYDKLAADEVATSSKIHRDRYAYGSAWLTWVIPDEMMKRIEALFA